MWNGTVRRVEDNEISSALSLSWRVFLETEGKAYTEEGRKAFHDAIFNDGYISQLSIYGAYEEDSLIGVLAYREKGSHVALFFVEKEHRGRGVGRALWEKSEKRDSVTVHSSLYARDIYGRLGFVERGCVKNEDGIVYVPMEWKR